MPEEIKVKEAEPEVKEGEEGETPEGETSETPEEKAVREEAEEKEAEEAETKKKERSFDRMQERLDEITAENYKLRSQVNELLEKPKASANKEVTKEDCYAVLANPDATPEQRAWVTDKLIELRVDEKVGGFRQEMTTEQKQSTARVASAQKALEDYPELDDNQSEIYQLAEKEYISGRLDRFEDGMEIAAERAAKKLGTSGPTKAQLQKKIDRDNKKKGLAAGATKVSTNNATVNYDKLKAEALKEGYGSAAWQKWDKAIVDRNKTKKG